MAIRKRPARGLFWPVCIEFPGREGHMTGKEVIEYGKSLGLMPVRIRELGKAKQLYSSHVEWHMTGYEILVDELEKDMEQTGTPGKKRAAL